MKVKLEAIDRGGSSITSPNVLLQIQPIIITAFEMSGPLGHPHILGLSLDKEADLLTMVFVAFRRPPPSQEMSAWMFLSPLLP